MRFLQRYHSYDNLDEGCLTMENLLDSVERNQRKGIYLRKSDSLCSDGLHDNSGQIIDAQSDFQVKSQLWLDKWNQLKTDQQRHRIERSPSTLRYHRRFVSRSRSLSPNREIRIRLTSQPPQRGPTPVVDLPSSVRHHYYYSSAINDPLSDNWKKIDLCEEARKSSARDVQRKIAESHRDLAILKSLIRNTYGGYDDEYHFATYGLHDRIGHIPSVETSEPRFKLDPEVLLNTIERRRRQHSVPSYTPIQFSGIYHSGLTHNIPLDVKYLAAKTSHLPGIHDPSQLAIKSTDNGPLPPFVYGSTHTKPFVEYHLDHIRSRLTDQYRSERTDYRKYYPISAIPLLHSRYCYTPVLARHSVLSSLDLATPRHIRIMPEQRYYTVDRSRQNMLVRNRVHQFRHGPPFLRSHSVIPLHPIKQPVFAVRPHVEHYRHSPIRHMHPPTFHLHKNLDLTDLELNLKPFTPHLSHHHHRQLAHYSPKVKIESGHDLCDSLLNLPHIPTYRRRYDTRSVYRPHLEIDKFSPHATVHRTQTRSLSPTYYPQHYGLLGAISSHLPSVTASRDIEFAKRDTSHLETLDKVLDDMEESKELYDHGYLTLPLHHSYYSGHDIDAAAYQFRPKQDYNFYRQLYRKQLTKHPQENYDHDYYYNRSFVDSSAVQESHQPVSNTIYPDGHFFEYQANANDIILSPPTRVTKPETYVRKSPYGEDASFVSERDFEPHYGEHRRYTII